MKRNQRGDPLARLRPASEAYVPVPVRVPVPVDAPGGAAGVPVLHSRGRHRSGAAPTISRAATEPDPGPNGLGDRLPQPGAASLVVIRRLLAPVALTVISAVVAGGLLWWFSAEDEQGFILSAAATAAPASAAAASAGAVSAGPAPGGAVSAGSAPVGSAVGSAAAAAPGVTPGPPATLHVAGAVATPGVVVVAGGARVVDAVTAAGGLTAEAAPDGVNLARQVLDGELVVVPTLGQLPTSPAAPAGAGPGAAPGGVVTGGPVTGGAVTGGAGGAAGGLIDLNRADVSALDTLPGIGPVLAERIVGYREDVGPFVVVEDLQSVPGIGDKVFGGIRDLVTV